MSLEDSIRQLAAEGTLEALERHLPAIFEGLALPVDPLTRYTRQEAAKRLRLPLRTFDERVKAGEITLFQD